MKRIFTAIGLGLLVWFFVTLLSTSIDAVGVWLYGWANDGYGYGAGAIILGPIAGVISVAFTYLEFEPK